jgi:hypothetical protein
VVGRGDDELITRVGIEDLEKAANHPLQLADLVIVVAPLADRIELVEASSDCIVVASATCRAARACIIARSKTPLTTVAKASTTSDRRNHRT